MNGLPMGAQAQQAPAGDPIDVSKMDLSSMLMEKLNLDPQTLGQMIEEMQGAQTPEEVIQIIKSYDRNPETMNEQYDPAAQAQGAPAPAPAGLPIGK